MMIRYLFLILLSFLPIGLFSQNYNEWVDKSFEYIKNSDWAGAENAILKALKSDPGNAQNALLLSNLGTIQRQLGKKEEALKSYNNALMITPRSVTLLKNRAALFSEMNRMEDALHDYNQVLLLDENEEESLYLRGLIRLENGDTTACRKDFEQLAKLNPTSSNARLGLAALMKCRHYYKEAIDLYSQVIKYNPDQAQLYIGRGEAYYYSRKLNDADKDIARALELDPEDPLIYVLRAKVKLARYEKDDATKDLEKAITLGFDRKTADSILKEHEYERIDLLKNN